MDSCSLRYFFLAAASFFLAIISLNLLRAATCLSVAPPLPLGGTGLPLGGTALPLATGGFLAAIIFIWIVFFILNYFFLGVLAFLLAFFAASVLGTNCLPCLLPAFFFASVLARSSLEREAHAFSGK
jgi:hypothetical protein